MPGALRELYPEITPYKTDTLKVDDLHTLHIEEYGNPNGIPVVYLHGGPGAGSSSFYAQYFDPEEYRIILFDQRGSGKSTPKHSMVDNTTWHLVEDIEKIRKHLNIDKWVVAGGSWGTTLGLVYAEKYAERVLGMILRGVFLARKEDCDTFSKDDSAAAQLYPDEWKTFKEEIAALMEKINLSSSGDMTKDAYNLIRCESRKVASKAASAWCLWEETVSSINPVSSSDQAWAASLDGINMGIMELTYMIEECFLQDYPILENVGRINEAGFPIYLFSGRFDLVCPTVQASALKTVLTNATQWFPTAGHAGDDAGNIDCFVRASNELVNQLLPEEKKNTTPPHLRDYLATPSAPQDDEKDVVPGLDCP